MTLETDISCLRQVPLFRSLPLPRLKLVALMGEKLRFDPGTQIIAEGETPEGVFVVLQGELEISHGGANGEGPRLPLHTGSLVGDTPSKPFGGGEEIDWSKDGRTVFFALREAGRIEPTSTNLDIFAAPADGSAEPTNLTADNDATDNLPTVSPDGRTLAYFAMARPGYEADRQVLMLRDLASGRVRALTQGWDRAVQMLGEEAKAVKRQINTRLIYPPAGSREEILKASIPT